MNGEQMLNGLMDKQMNGYKDGWLYRMNKMVGLMNNKKRERLKR